MLGFSAQSAASQWSADEVANPNEIQLIPIKSAGLDKENKHELTPVLWTVFQMNVLFNKGRTVWKLWSGDEQT